MCGKSMMNVRRFSKDHSLWVRESEDGAASDLDDDGDAMKGASNRSRSAFIIELPSTSQGQFSGGCEENCAKFMALQIVPLDLIQEVANNDLTRCLSTGQEILNLVDCSCKKLRLAQASKHVVNWFHAYLSAWE